MLNLNYPSVSHRPGKRAFTLVELLVVISIIVLVLALAVPLLNVFRGGRSLDGAENIVSAMLQRARSRAIGLQEQRGVFFFEEKTSGKTAMVTVKININRTNGISFVDLDPAADEMQYMPSGIGAAFILGPTGAAGQTSTGYQPVGLILYDGVGRVVPLPAYQVDGPGNNSYSFNLHDRFDTSGGLPNITSPGDPAQFGLLLYDKPNFNDVDKSGASDQNYSAAQSKWLDANGLALIVNRYNGTLFRGD